jgi:hypothetical protein
MGVAKAPLCNPALVTITQGYRYLEVSRMCGYRQVGECTILYSDLCLIYSPTLKK